MTNNQTKSMSSGMLKPMLLQVLLLLIFLFGAGWSFGHRLVFLPVLMSIAPFIWHINLQLQRFRSEISEGFHVPFEVYLALSIGLGAILIVVGIAWGHYYPSSVLLFPLLSLVVYLGPWQYLLQASTMPLIPLNNLIFFVILACLCILSYLLPMFLRLTPTPSLQPPSLGGG